MNQLINGRVAAFQPDSYLRRAGTCLLITSLVWLVAVLVVPRTAQAEFDGGVGIFLPVSPLSSNNLNYWVVPKAKTARSYGLQFVNLIVQWKDIEPKDDGFAFQTLGNFIKAVKKEGLQCILRIYFNGGSWIQSSPSWLFDQKKAAYYWEEGYRQPVPWDQTYLEEITEFMLKFGLWLKDNPAYRPDGWQMSVGGIYGEEAILGYDWQAVFKNDYDAFYLKLMDAEKKHVNVHAALSNLLSTISPILMVNHMYDGNPEMNDLLMQHAMNLKVGWFQSNSWSGELLDAWYGPYLLEMLARHKDKDGNRFFLEDEYGSKSSTPVSDRLIKIGQIESDFGIRFKAVSLSVDDLSAANRPAITSLVSRVLAP